MKDVLLGAIARFSEGDLDGYMQLYDPSVQAHGFAPVPLGLAELRAFYEGIFGAFSDLRLRADDLIAEGEKVVCRFTMTGRHTGVFLGAPPAGKSFSVEGITILKMRDGRCVERWSSLDQLGLLTHIGAFPAPV